MANDIYHVDFHTSQSLIFSAREQWKKNENDSSTMIRE